MWYKKGDKIISVYWFVILIIVSVAVVYGISAFYSHPYDVRAIEAEVLSNKVADCFSSSGKLNDGLFKDGSFDPEFNQKFMSFCKLDFNPEKSFESVEQYYVKADFYKVDNLNEPTFVAYVGNQNLASNCEIQKEEDYKRIAKCLEKRFYATYAGDQYLIKILSVVRKTEKNVK